MIHIHENHTALGLDKNPVNEHMMKTFGDGAIEAILQAQITTDLATLMVALFDKYGKGKTADMIETAMK